MTISCWSAGRGWNAGWSESFLSVDDAEQAVDLDEPFMADWPQEGRTAYLRFIAEDLYVVEVHDGTSTQVVVSVPLDLREGWMAESRERLAAARAALGRPGARGFRGSAARRRTEKGSASSPASCAPGSVADTPPDRPPTAQVPSAHHSNGRQGIRGYGRAAPLRAAPVGLAPGAHAGQQACGSTGPSGSAE
ncbi:MULTISPECIES: DUF5959 family protein [unclassified Streptomyces]|uniref:DUF5959 family protein n=1 Tax=unclassified Streptomyces TaxID=2593676 RepID=UPI00227722F4|nr:MULTISPECIES: DUF5959 family protein [unclassified Streptomyces]